MSKYKHIKELNEKNYEDIIAVLEEGYDLLGQAKEQFEWVAREVGGRIGGYMESYLINYLDAYINGGESDNGSREDIIFQIEEIYNQNQDE